MQLFKSIVSNKIIILLSALLIIGIISCSDHRSPTEPEAGVPGGDPTVLTAENHPEGFGSADCQFCHNKNEISGHATITPEQCAGCHGSNGVGEDDQLCLTCHGFPPSAGAHNNHPTFGMSTFHADPRSGQLMSRPRSSRNDRRPGLKQTLSGAGVSSGSAFTQTASIDGSCNLCHYGAGSGTANHRNGILDVIIDPTYPGTYTGGTCSVVVCHGGGDPDWFSDTDLSCTDCHAVDSGFFNDPVSGNHPDHIQRTQSDCSICHEAGPSTHYNQMMDNPDNIKPDSGFYRDDTPDGYNPEGSSGGCYGMTSPCHGTGQEVPWDPSGVCGICHGVTPDEPPTTGAHQLHAGTGFAYACATCHYGFDEGTGSEHNNGNADVAIHPDFGGTFNGQTCSSVSCHGSGQPDWFGDTNLGCTECHSTSGNTSSDPGSGLHSTHMANSGIACGTCHSGSPSTHYNHVMDNPDRIVPDGGSYADTSPGGFNPNGSSGSCSGMTSPCHSSGEWDSDPASSCGSCHGVTPETPPSGGAHGPHAGVSGRSYDCSMCHYGFSSGEGPNHYNGLVDIAFDPASLAGDGNPAFSGGTCSGIYCHGEGNRPLPDGTDTTPEWGNPSTGQCGTCHGASDASPPTTGRHESHVMNYNIDCSICHFGAGPEPGMMPDGILEVNFNPASQPDGSYEYGSSPNDGSCSSITCHGDRGW